MVEEIGKLTEKSPAPAATAAAASASVKESDPELASKRAMSKEEGELTSSDEDVLPLRSVGPLSNASVHPSSSIPEVSVEANTQHAKSGKTFSMKPPAGLVDVPSHLPIQFGYNKRFLKNQVPFKSNNSGRTPYGSNNDLVISFSDDDESGSDTEQHRRVNALKTNSNPLLVSRRKKPPVLPPLKLGTVQRTVMNEREALTKMDCKSRTFISSVADISRAGSRSARSFLAEQRSYSKNSNSVKKYSASKEHECSKSTVMNTSELQDLRQQIAIRENELKLKRVQTKGSMPDLLRDHNPTNKDSTASRKIHAMPVDIPFGPEEPETKRLKVTHSNSGEQPSSLGQEKLSFRFVQPVEGQSSDKSVTEARSTDDRDCHDGQLPQKEALLGCAGSQIKDGAVGRELLAPICRPREVLIMSNSNASLPKPAVQTLQTASGLKKLVHPAKSNGNPQAAVGNTVIKSGIYHQENISGHEKLHSKLNGTSKFVQISPDNASPIYYSSRPTIRDNMDLRSLFEIEELNDKELEEAQELRHRCEIEERTALKAYRDAQRALAEANARCIFLYHRRESYAAELRSFLMEGGSSLLWPKEHGQIGEAWNFFTNSGTKTDLIPTSSHRVQAEFDAGNQMHYDSNVHNQMYFDSNVHKLECGARSRFFPNMNGQNFGSEACSEPDVSTSDLLPHKNYGTAILSPPDDLNMLADEDEETFAAENVSGQAIVEYLRKEKNVETSSRDVDDDLVVNFSVNDSKDPLLLEAELRSKLCSRFGVITSSRRNADYGRAAAIERTAEADTTNFVTEMIRKDISVPPDLQTSRSPVFENESIYSREPPTLKDVENDIGNMRTQMLVHNISVCSPEKSEIVGIGGFSSNPEGTCPSNVCNLDSPALSASIFKSVFYPLKAKHPVGSSNMQVIDQQNFDAASDDSWSIKSKENQLSVGGENFVAEIVRHELTGGIDSYISGSAIHPFWPLCMYELRGKCNNEECPWQHSKDYCNPNFNQHHCSDNNADCQVGLNCMKPRSGVEFSKVLTPPTYLISLDTLRADSFLSGSALSRKLGPCGRNIFSSSLILSNSLPRWLPSDEPFLHGSDGRIDTLGSFNRQNSYFRRRNSNMSLSGNIFADKEQSLEVALYILNQEVNKAEGVKKSLSLLSRALEADPTSVGLWLVYLHFYYGDKRLSVGEDDMFLCAVEHNEGSYELWLMYINSREQLNARFSAYERALTSLCHHSVSCDEAVHASAYILDLFLQMLNCFTLSGNIEKAIQRIYGLFHVERDADESCSLPFSDILPCLTVAGKCIFWVSCAYLVIYRKLPDKVVRQFEYEKEMPLIEWPPVDIKTKDKEELYKMIEMAVDSTELDIDCKSLANRTAHRSCHLLAVNLVKLVAAVDGVESCRTLLDKYMKLYPSCLELVLLSVGILNRNSKGVMLLGFEEALCNWPGAGVHCLWNQYAQLAIQNGESGKARDIMDRWFTSVNVLDDEDGDGKNGLSDPVLVCGSDGSLSHTNKTDAMFGLLNLSLYRLLGNHLPEASQAVDRALMVAGPEDFQHCIREHALFCLKYGPELRKDVSLNSLPGVLKNYRNQARDFLSPSSLPRKFIQDIQKPSLRQLVDGLFIPASPDFSVVNLVLETWFGPSLMPQGSGKLKDLVDFIESILEVSPANYPLVLSACKLLTSDSNVVDSRSPSTLFWASSLLVNTMYEAIPLAPEYVWVEAAGLLGKLTSTQEVSDSFHRRALSAYPFSIKLWRSFLKSSADTSTRNNVATSARERGMELES
ncbi:hypothetical protein Dimus_011360 [Dionaea muscipula]